MGIKELLTADGRQRRRVERLTRRLCDRYGPSEDRWTAADDLAKIATEDAVYGLLRRFLAVSDKISEDREEKRHVQDLIVKLGGPALPAIRGFIRREADAVLAIECLRRMREGEALVEELLGILKSVGPHAARPNQLTPVIETLTGLGGARVVEAVAPYLQSFDDSIRLASIECLDKIGDDRVREPLLALASDENTSPRIQERLVQALTAHGWALPKGSKKSAKRT